MELSKSLVTGLIIAASLLGGCASNHTQDQAQALFSRQWVERARSGYSDPRDPFEPVNREIWDFNWDVGCLYLTPNNSYLRDCDASACANWFVNITDNLQEPANFLNNMFQGKVDDGLDSLARF